MTKELIERIRIQMIKHPNSELWNRDTNKWKTEHHKEFEAMENNKISVKVKRQNNGVPVQVIRLSDGKIYKTVAECMKVNKYHCKQMQQYLNEQILYKRCEN